MNAAQYHPEHDRTSCSDESPINADPACSAGCARCTALLLDQRTELLTALRQLMDAPKQGTHAAMKRARERAQTAIDNAHKA